MTSIQYLNMYFLFALQCTCDRKKIAVGDRTLHLLAHRTGSTVEKMRFYLDRWMRSHVEFVTRVSKTLLQCKKCSVEDYMHSIVQPGVPLDEIGLVVWTCMYHKHICILMNGKYWSTQAEHDSTKCNYFIAFRGNLEFTNTVQATGLTPPPSPKPDAEASGSSSSSPDSSSEDEKGSGSDSDSKKRKKPSAAKGKASDNESDKESAKADDVTPVGTKP